MSLTPGTHLGQLTDEEHKMKSDNSPDVQPVPPSQPQSSGSLSTPPNSFSASCLAHLRRKWEPPLKPGMIRMKHRYGCGRELYDDFPLEHRAAAEQLAEKLRKTGWRCELFQNVGSQGVITLALPGTETSADSSGTDHDGGPADARQLTMSWGEKPGASYGYGRADKNENKLEKGDENVETASWVFACFDAAHGMVVVPHEVTPDLSDETLFSAFREDYFRHNSFFRRSIAAVFQKLKIEFIGFTIIPYDVPGILEKRDQWPRWLEGHMWFYSRESVEEDFTPVLPAYLSRVWASPHKAEQEAWERRNGSKGRSLILHGLGEHLHHFFDRHAGNQDCNRPYQARGERCTVILDSMPKRRMTRQEIESAALTGDFSGLDGDCFYGIHFTTERNLMWPWGAYTAFSIALCCWYLAIRDRDPYRFLLLFLSTVLQIMALLLYALFSAL